MSETRQYLPPIHTSAETAFVNEDYPYGFTLRCKRRVWIETTKQGQRFVTQTTDPRKSVETWNKPKKSTYAQVAVLFLDENGHIQWDSLSISSPEEEITSFEKRAANALDTRERVGIVLIRTINKAYCNTRIEVKYDIGETAAIPTV